MREQILTEKQKKWAEHIKQAKEKGLSYAQYCKQEQLKASLMHYYASKLRRKSQKTDTNSPFIEIKPLVPSPIPNVVIRIGNQVSMEIPADLSFLISLLRGLG